MNEASINKILEHIKNKGMPPTLGYVIDKRIFAIIAEAAAKNIYEWGWERYVEYMNGWLLKLK